MKSQHLLDLSKKLQIGQSGKLIFDRLGIRMIKELDQACTSRL
jgi:hypothetical protein